MQETVTPEPPLVHRMHGQVPQGHAYRLDRAPQAHLTIKENVALPSRPVTQNLTIKGDVALLSRPAPQGHAYRSDRAPQAHLTIKGNVTIPSRPVPQDLTIEGNVALPSRPVPQGHDYRLDQVLQAHSTIEGYAALPSLPPPLALGSRRPRHASPVTGATGLPRWRRTRPNARQHLRVRPAISTGCT